MSKLKKKSGNYLEFVPYRNPKFDSVTDDNGNVIILKKNEGIFCKITQKVFGKPAVSQIHLDDMGSFIWLLIDGEKNILLIAELVKAEFGDKAEPLYNRLVQYFVTLEQYGFILFTS